MPIRRRTESAGCDVEGAVTLQNPDVVIHVPALIEFLSSQTFEDGTERELGTMLVVVGEGRWRVWMNDKAQGLSCWVSALTLGDALQVADEVARGEAGEWRATKPPQRGRGR